MWTLDLAKDFFRIRHFLIKNGILNVTYDFSKNEIFLNFQKICKSRDLECRKDM